MSKKLFKESFVTLQDKEGHDYAVDIEAQEEKRRQERKEKKKSSRKNKVKKIVKGILSRFKRK